MPDPAKAPQMGTILILNGASSSGKTTLLRLLQNQLAEPYLEAGIDKFIWMLPKRYLDVPHWHEIFEYRWHEQAGERRLEICAGPQGKVLFSGMHQAIAALAWGGNNVLADHVLIEPEWVAECARLFAGLPAYLIGIRCSLEILEERERAREDRTLGQARAYHEKVHAHALYDLEVDTGRDDPGTCARQIIDFLAAGPAPRAFPALRWQT